MILWCKLNKTVILKMTQALYCALQAPYCAVQTLYCAVQAPYCAEAISTAQQRDLLCSRALYRAVESYTALAIVLHSREISTAQYTIRTALYLSKTSADLS